jgi:pantetheine-phosphate adenylyltransferase
MKKIAFAGTFDPITNGHLWVIEEALNIAEEVVVIIAVNNTKKPLFDEITRKVMIEQAIKKLPNHERVSVKVLKNEYVAQAAIVNFGCDYLIRGIRSALDFDYETLIQKTNTDILCGAKTIFVMPPRDLESVSSSFVKALVGPVGWHWNIQEFVPEFVYRHWVQKYIKEVALSFCQDSKIVDFVTEITSFYSDEGRYYHNMDHLAHCMQELEWLSLNTNQSQEDLKNLCIALLGHDVIYGENMEGHSDEELSAEWTQAWALNKELLNEEQAQTVKELIEKTQYLSKKLTLDTNLEKLMCSIDLAVLGKNKKVYDKYKTNIRKEYQQVPDAVYSAGRINALKKLLEMPKLYESDNFEHYELLARNNLQDEIIQLSN